MLQTRKPEATPPAWRDWRSLLVVAGALFALTPWATPAVALGLGIVLALTVGNPLRGATSKAAKKLLKASVVGLGFGIPVAELFGTGATGVAFAVAGILFALTAGLLLGRLLVVDRDTSWLVSGGTAICGGSAIAAIGPAIRARTEAMNVALATVFLLNAVALYVFPPVGHALAMTQEQFGYWAAVAIHDTSSVVGAAAAYGTRALEVATVTKLARAVWIAPLALGLAWWAARSDRRAGRADAGGAPVKVPWFIGLFVLATVVRALVPAGAPAFDRVADLARVGLVLTLFLIGAGLSRASLRAVGHRPFLQGVALWLLVSVVSLAAVLWLVPDA